MEKAPSLTEKYGKQVYEVVTVSRSIFHSQVEHPDYGYGSKTAYHMDLQVLKDFLQAEHDEVIVSIRSASDEDPDESNQG